MLHPCISQQPCLTSMSTLKTTFWDPEELSNLPRITQQQVTYNLKGKVKAPALTLCYFWQCSEVLMILYLCLVKSMVTLLPGFLSPRDILPAETSFPDNEPTGLLLLLRDSFTYFPPTAAKCSSFQTSPSYTRDIFYLRMIEIMLWQLHLLFKMFFFFLHQKRQRTLFRSLLNWEVFVSKLSS